ncbi:helix-turn-helix domain-containing protein, partial [Listeria monocytogenes]|uniref:helix-turn-helix domain-containing protein n=1 Tax=Listeria monocytogenes TaxID=1639 RepID=UPI002FDC3DDC
ADQDLHGTASVGEKHYKAVITDEEIEEIKKLALTMTQREIAKLKNTTQPTISRILSGTRRSNGT